MSEEAKILVVAETDGEQIASITYELLQGGRITQEKKGSGVICCAIIGDRVAAVSDELADYSDEVYVLDHSRLRDFQSDVYLSCLTAIIERIQPSIILMAQTINNLDVAPRLALAVDAPLITDVIEIGNDSTGSGLVCIKPVYGDKAMAGFRLDAQTAVVTLRPKSFSTATKSSRRGKITQVTLDVNQFVARTEHVDTVTGESVSLDRADAIVAGGRGIKDVDGLAHLEGLIQALKMFFSNVELGASRPLVDRGWVPPSRQVGLTGEKVAPDLYVAVAISGASQHLSGITGSKKIIAINQDETAAIFEQSDYAIVGEYEQVVPVLAQKLKELS